MNERNPSEPTLDESPARRPSSRARRVAHRLVTAALLLTGLAGLTRLWDEARHSGANTEDRTPITSPRPGETLRADCHSREPDDCRSWYGVEISACWRPACRAVNGFSTTPQGFVGPDDRLIEKEKPPGTFRILALGGSTTAGMAHGHSWPAKLETMLGQRHSSEASGARIEVLNLGLSGGSSLDSFELYTTIGSSFRPDLIILGEEVNDFGGCQPFLEPTVDGATQAEIVAGYLAGDSSLEEVAALSPWFERHQSHYAEARARGIATGSAAAVMDRLMPRRAEGRTGDSTSESCRQNRNIDEQATSPFDDYQQGWAHTRRRYDRILEAARAHGTQHIVVSTVPHAFEAWACPTSSCAPVIDLLDWRRYLTQVHNPGVRAYAARNGLGLVDLERVFDDFADGRNTTGAPVREIYLDYAEAQARTAQQVMEDFATGRPGKRWLFAGEWMHPSAGGYTLVASAYLEALRPDARLRVESGP